MRILAIAAAAAIGLSLVAAVDVQAKSKAKCVRAGGQGTGIEEGIAKAMAKEALGQSIAAGKMKARGKIAYKCSGGPLLPTCTATQRACK
ncbi:MAG: hypothetical protein AB7O43_12960 [Hyphomicrobiaceae bacterium]